jgi:hypothetical protein
VKSANPPASDTQSRTAGIATARGPRFGPSTDASASPSSNPPILASATITQ